MEESQSSKLIVKGSSPFAPAKACKLKKKQTFYYQKASPIRRIVARFVDLILISSILILLDLLINVRHLDKWNAYLHNRPSTLNTSIAALPLLFAFIIEISYFIFLAYNCNCQTPGKKIVAIRVIDQLTLKKPSIKQFIKHEALISILPAICTLFFFFFFISFGNKLNIFSFFDNSANPKLSKLQQSVLAGIQCLYGFSNVIILFITIFFMLSKKRTALHDLISKTWTIDNKKKLLLKVDPEKNHNKADSNPLTTLHKYKE